MNQNLLIIRQAGSACASTRHSHCLLQCSYIGFRFVRYQCSPWLSLAIAPLKLLFVSGMKRTREQIRYFRAIARIDFVGVYSLLNDLLW